MPYSYIQLAGNGVATTFAFAFGYLSKTHISVKVNNVAASFTWVTDFSVQILPAPTNGSIVEIRRITPLNEPIVDWSDGSVLTESDLDLNTLFSLYTAQEAQDGVSDSMVVNSLNQWDGEGKSTTNFADATTPTGLITKNQLDTAYVPSFNAAVAAAAASASAAASSASDSSTSANTALSYLNTFRSQYLGALASDPTLDVTGSPVTAGDLYYNTVSNAMKVYNGTMWAFAQVTVPGTIKRPATPLIATSGQTTFTVAGGYDVGYITVYQNGVLVHPPAVTATNGTTIVFSPGLTAGTEVDYIAFGSFQIANPVIDNTSAANYVQTRTNRVVSNIAALRATGVNSYDSVFVTCYATPGDGGGGTYRRDAADTATADNGGSVIVTSGGERFKLDITNGVSVKQFGAKGDNSTDDAVAINAAITAVNAAGGGQVEFPSGTYIVGAQVTARSNVTLVGSGQVSTIIKAKNATDFRYVVFGSSLTNFSIRDMTIDANQASRTGVQAGLFYGLFLQNCTYTLLQGSTFKNALGFGSTIGACCMLDGVSTTFARIQSCTAEGGGTLSLPAYGFSMSGLYGTIAQCSANTGFEAAFRLVNSQSCGISGCISQSFNVGAAIVTDANSDSTGNFIQGLICFGGNSTSGTVQIGTKVSGTTGNVSQVSLSNVRLISNLNVGFRILKTGTAPTPTNISVTGCDCDGGAGENLRGVGANVTVQSCNFTGSNATFGIVNCEAGSSNWYVRNSSLRGTCLYGVRIDTANVVEVNGCTIIGSGVASSYGIYAFGTGTNVQIYNNDINAFASGLVGSDAGTTVYVANFQNSKDGLIFGKQADGTNIYRSGTGMIRSDGKICAVQGLAVGNAASIGTAGSIVYHMPVFDGGGTQLGFVKIYNS